MAATTYGTAHVYGVETSITNATVLSFSVVENSENAEQTEDESGNVIERRRDDIHYRATIELRYTSIYSMPSVQSTLAYDDGEGSQTYEIEEVTKNQVNKGFRTVTLSLLRSENISYV